ncbi:MAG: rod shape-determining protein MreD [Arenicellales bacterium]
MISLGASPRRLWIPFMTIFVALVLIVLPMQDLVRGFMPDWVSLVLIYWAMAMPGRMGIPIGWFAGLLVDILTMGIPGAHALSKAVIVYATASLATRVRAFPLWQQSVVVMLLVGLEVLLLSLTGLLVGEKVAGLHLWTAVVVGGLVWPAVYHVLRRLRLSTTMGGN